MSSEVMISLKDIHKSYNKSSETIKGVSFEVTAGEVYGLLGPNGAGKTTLMQMISTLSSPTSGDITICGMSPAKDRLKIHEKIGFLTTEVKLDPLSTPDKLYDFFAALYNIDKAEVPARKQIAFERFGIHPFANKRIIELSTGMKQKVSLVVAVAHDPDIIIFDEPTNGLDVITAKVVTDFLLELKEQGKTVVISTHIFSLIEKVCDRVGIIIDGKMVTVGTLDKITGGRPLEDVFFELYRERKGDEL